MSHVYHQQIDNLIKSNKLFRFDAELKDLDNNENNRDRIDLLNQIITHEQSIKNPQQLQEETFKHHIQILKESQYQKRWQFLNEEQRLNRLDDYITRTYITNEKIISELKKRIKDTSLKSKHVLYNQLKGIIDDITILEIDDNHNYHIVDEVRKPVKLKDNNVVDGVKKLVKLKDNNVINEVKKPVKLNDNNIDPNSDDNMTNKKNNHDLNKSIRKRVVKRKSNLD